MGLHDRSQSSGTTNYLSIRNGKFIQSSSASVPGVIERINKKGNPVYELHFDNDFVGSLLGVSITPNNYDGKDEIKMNFVDSDHIRWVIQFPLRSPHGRRFMSTFWNIDANQELVVSPYYFLPKGTSDYVSGMNLLQLGQKVSPFYTKDEPGQVPPLSFVVVKGEQVVDDTERVNYLKQLFDHWRGTNFPDSVAKEAEQAQQQQAHRATQPTKAPYRYAQASPVPLSPPTTVPKAFVPPTPPAPKAAVTAPFVAEPDLNSEDNLPF